MFSNEVRIFSNDQKMSERWESKKLFFVLLTNVLGILVRQMKEKYHWKPLSSVNNFKSTLIYIWINKSFIWNGTVFFFSFFCCSWFDVYIHFWDANFASDNVSFFFTQPRQERSNHWQLLSFDYWRLQFQDWLTLAISELLLRLSNFSWQLFTLHHRYLQSIQICWTILIIQRQFYRMRHSQNISMFHSLYNMVIFVVFVIFFNFVTIRMNVIVNFELHWFFVRMLKMIDGHFRWLKIYWRKVLESPWKIMHDEMRSLKEWTFLDSIRCFVCFGYLDYIMLVLYNVCHWWNYICPV